MGQAWQCDVISYEEYHPYGTTAWQADKSGLTARAKRYRYTQKERDAWTGLSYHGARYYAPWLGRWESADPAGMVDGVNRYAYALGNPVSGRDPSGMGTVTTPFPRPYSVATTNRNLQPQIGPPPGQELQQQVPYVPGAPPTSPAEVARAKTFDSAHRLATGNPIPAQNLDLALALGESAPNGGDVGFLEKAEVAAGKPMNTLVGLFTDVAYSTPTPGGPPPIIGWAPLTHQNDLIESHPLLLAESARLIDENNVKVVGVNQSSHQSPPDLAVGQIADYLEVRSGSKPATRDRVNVYDSMFGDDPLPAADRFANLGHFWIRGVNIEREGDVTSLNLQVWDAPGFEGNVTRPVAVYGVTIDHGNESITIESPVPDPEADRHTNAIREITTQNPNFILPTPR